MGTSGNGIRTDGARTTATTAVLLAAAVVLGALVVLVALLALVVLDDGWTKVIWAGVAVLLVWQLVPRPPGLSPRAVPLPPQDAPAVHRLVDEVSGAVGARHPDAVVVDTVYASSLLRHGYLGRATLVLGLPQWTVLDGDERVATLAHELVCGQRGRGPAGVLVRLADDLLTRLVLLLSPTGVVQPHEAAREQYDSGLGVLGAGDDLAGDRMRREVATSVGAAGLTVVSAPARALQRLLHRAVRPVLTQDCLAADRAAAALVGTPAVVQLLLSTLDVPRGSVSAEVAARRRLDPFAALAEAERPAADELARRLAAASSSGVTCGPGHAPTATRVEALQRGDVVVTRGVGPATVRAADQELDAQRGRLAGRYAEELVHGRP